MVHRKEAAQEEKWEKLASLMGGEGRRGEMREKRGKEGRERREVGQGRGRGKKGRFNPMLIITFV